MSWIVNTKSATLDLTIAKENPLYAGCEIEEVPGGWRLAQKPVEIINTIARNAEEIIRRLVAEGVEDLTLTGRSAIWVYLVVFHSALHRITEIYYTNGKPDGRIRIAAH